MRRKIISLLLICILALGLCAGCFGSRVTASAENDVQGEAALIEIDQGESVGYAISFVVPKDCLSVEPILFAKTFGKRTRDLMYGMNVDGDVIFSDDKIYSVTSEDGKRQFSVQYSTDASDNLLAMSQIVLPSRADYLAYMNDQPNFGIEPLIGSMKSDYYREQVKGLYIDKGYFSVPLPNRSWYTDLPSAYDGEGALGSLFAVGLSDGLASVFTSDAFNRWVGGVHISYYFSSFTFSHCDGATTKTANGSRLLGWTSQHATPGDFVENGISAFIHVQRTWAWALIILAILIVFAGIGFLSVYLVNRNKRKNGENPPPPASGNPFDPPPDPFAAPPAPKNPFGSDYDG